MNDLVCNWRNILQLLNPYRPRCIQGFLDADVLAWAFKRRAQNKVKQIKENISHLLKYSMQLPLHFYKFKYDY